MMRANPKRPAYKRWFSKIVALAIKQFGLKDRPEAEEFLERVAGRFHLDYRKLYSLKGGYGADPEAVIHLIARYMRQEADTEAQRAGGFNRREWTALLIVDLREQLPFLTTDEEARHFIEYIQRRHGIDVRAMYDAGWSPTTAFRAIIARLSEEADVDKAEADVKEDENNGHGNGHGNGHSGVPLLPGDIISLLYGDFFTHPYAGGHKARAFQPDPGLPFGVKAQANDQNVINVSEVANVVATHGVHALVGGDQDALAFMLSLFAKGDWGKVGREDWEQNNRRLASKGMILGEYILKGQQVWIILDAGWQTLTFLLPEEY